MPSDDPKGGPKGDPSQTLNELFETVSQLDTTSQERVRDGLAQLIADAGQAPAAKLHRTIRARWLEQAEQIIAALRPVVRVVLDRSGMLPSKGASKVGGMPDLPAGHSWPLSVGGAPLAFIGQIDLAELMDLDGAGPLPESGRLSLFCDHSPGALATGAPEHHLEYIDTDPHGLSPLDWPEVLDEQDGVFVEVGLVLDQSWVLCPRAIPAELEAEVARVLPSGIGRIGGTPSRPLLPSGPDEVLLLDLEAFDVVRVPGSSDSPFGQGRLSLVISAQDLSARAFQHARLTYHPAG